MLINTKSCCGILQSKGLVCLCHITLTITLQAKNCFKKKVEQLYIRTVYSD